PLSKPAYVKSLQHHRIETIPRQRDSPPWHGEEEGRRRPSRDQERSPHLQSKPARATDLGGGVEEIRARQSDSTWIEDDQQERRLPDPEEGRANRRLIRSGDFFARYRGFASAAFFRRP